jgi:hypothetical protein
MDPTNDASVESVLNLLDLSEKDSLEKRVY